MTNSDRASALAGISAALEGKPTQILRGDPAGIIEEARDACERLDITGVRFWIQGGAACFAPEGVEVPWETSGSS
jgi:hypothetical protein